MTPPPPFLSNRPSKTAIHSATGGLGFRRDIEGLRAVAVVAVVLYHADMPFVSGGYAGVDVFFVVSGYLITRLLVEEYGRTGKIDLPRFYSRRMLRLLPALSLVIIATLAAGAWLYSPLEQRTLGRTAFATAVYASNILFMADAGDYFSTALESNPLLHTWSLAVEEQFYLLWPILIGLLLRRGGSKKKLPTGLVLITVSSFALSAYLSLTVESWAFFSSPTRAWQFGAGALATLVPVVWLRRHAGIALGASWCGFLLLCLSLILLRPGPPYPGFLALLPTSATCLLLVANASGQNSRVERMLSLPVLQFLGAISYSWYLWHWPVLVFVAAVVPSMTLPVSLASVGASLVLAAATFSWLENPIRYRPSLRNRTRPALALGLLLVMLCSVAAAGAHRFAAEMASREPYRGYEAAVADLTPTAECEVWRRGDEHRSCEGGAPITGGAMPTIVLFGDSHAAQWIPAIRRAALNEGWRFVSMTRGACPSVLVTPDPPNGGSREVDACAEWRQRSAATIVSMQPDLLIVTNSREHVVGPRRKDVRRRATLGEWRRGTREMLTQLSRSGAEIVLLRDTPRLGVNVPFCLARADWRPSWLSQDCSSARAAATDSAVYRAELRAVLEVPNARALDATDLFCELQFCPAVRDGTVVYRDFDHVAGEYMTGISSEFWQILPLPRHL